MAEKPGKRILEISAEYGVTRQTVYNWRAEGAPVDDPDGLRLWLDEKGRLVNESEDIKQARIRVLNQTERRLKRENDRAERTIIDRVEVEQALNKVVPIFFDRIETALCYELPPALAGKSPEQIAATCREAITKLIQTAKAELAEIAKE